VALDSAVDWVTYFLMTGVSGIRLRGQIFGLQQLDSEAD
jgi:hypothetical protein